VNIVGILLAAGAGERFGGEKLLAPLPGSAPECALGAVACRNLVAALPEVVAVVRPGDMALADALHAAGARVIECRDAADGMGASLACGVRATGHADGWVVALADMPWIRPETIARVAAAVANGATVAAPFHDGTRGHPVGFANSCRAELAALGTDEGARSVIVTHRDALLRIDVDDPGVLRDVDTAQDLRLA
jgi:molybdenum cofactor cytidylyltransferase